jgi:hypothetical protein
MTIKISYISKMEYSQHPDYSFFIHIQYAGKEGDIIIIRIQLELIKH